MNHKIAVNKAFLEWYSARSRNSIQINQLCIQKRILEIKCRILELEIQEDLLKSDK